MKVDILGIKIDKVTISQAIDQINGWLKKAGRHYIVTPNIEFIMAAQKDEVFKKILNEADLSIPDSARLGWAGKMLASKNLLQRLAIWPWFIAPRVLTSNFPVTTGTDLMSKLIELSAEKGYKIGLLGGSNGVAEKLAKKLRLSYPNLEITYTECGGEVDYDGNQGFVSQIPPTDILFVAFGQIKQEKWIAKNLHKSNTKIMMGVGGAFDYLSGEISRAPGIVRSLGFEWLYRVVKQPRRIKRFGALVKFVITIAKF